MPPAAAWRLGVAQVGQLPQRLVVVERDDLMMGPRRAANDDLRPLDHRALRVLCKRACDSRTSWASSCDLDVQENVRYDAGAATVGKGVKVGLRDLLSSVTGACRPECSRWPGLNSSRRAWVRSATSPWAHSRPSTLSSIPSGTGRPGPPRSAVGAGGRARRRDALSRRAGQYEARPRGEQVGDARCP